MFNKMMEDIRH